MCVFSLKCKYFVYDVFQVRFCYVQRDNTGTLFKVHAFAYFRRHQHFLTYIIINKAKRLETNIIVLMTLFAFLNIYKLCYTCKFINCILR